MARNQRKYDAEYKVQAVKLSNEIGSSKAAVELGIPVDTLYGWVKAAKEGRLDIGGGAVRSDIEQRNGFLSGFARCYPSFRPRCSVYKRFVPQSNHTVWYPAKHE